MAAVHPQPSQEVLPPGWECRFDTRTGRYYFINHAEHITTWEDPRLRHSQVQQGSYAKYYLYGNGKPATGFAKPGFTQGYGYGSPHFMPPANPPGSPGHPPGVPPPTADGVSVQVDERILMKLCMQFPMVEEGHIWQLLKQYHNRENIVVSALLAEGYPRAPTHSITCDQMTPKLMRIDEHVVQKLHNFFPTVDIEHIRGLMKIHNNQEHEVIGCLVSAGGSPARPRIHSPYPSSPKMKLRYLKLVFPEADEAMLFDVLYNCDNNAQEAMTRLTNMGYKKRETPIGRRTPSQLQQTPSKTLQDAHRMSPSRTRTPPTLADKNKMMARLQDQFPAVSRTLINMALESSNYQEERAKQFLIAMTPQDGSKQVTSHPEVSQAAAEQQSQPQPLPATQDLPAVPPEAPPVPPRSRHTSSQDGEGKTSSRLSLLEQLSNRGDLSSDTTVEKPSCWLTRRVSLWKPRQKSKEYPGQPSEKQSHSIFDIGKRIRVKFLKQITRVSKATSTQEDQQEALEPNKTRPKGPDASLRKGPNEKNLLKEYLPWIGPNPKNRKGPDPSLRRGPDPKNLGARSESRAKGPQPVLRRGPLSSILCHPFSPSSSTSGVETDNTRSS